MAYFQNENLLSNNWLLKHTAAIIWMVTSIRLPMGSSVLNHTKDFAQKCGL